MKIFVISLKRSVERREAIINQFARTSFCFEIFDAIDGNAEASRHFLRFDPRTYQLNTYRSPAPGEIACYASHLELWKYSARADQPIVVLEDDCMLDIRFEEAVRATARLIDRFGFIRLQGSLRKRRFRVGNTAHSIHAVDGFDLYYLSRVPLCLTGYAICPASAAQLAAASLTLTAPVDKFVQRTWDHQAPIFGLEPACVSVSPLGRTSTIGDRSVNSGDRSAPAKVGFSIMCDRRYTSPRHIKESLGVRLFEA